MFGGANLRVGYPLTPNLEAVLVATVASIFAKLTFPFICLAA